MIHELKIVPEFFEDVISGKKTFEVRKNDRPFHEGDLLALNEYDPGNKSYTGKSCIVYIDYLMNNADYCKNGYVIMAIKPCSVHRFGNPVNPLKLTEDYRIPLATKGE